MADTKAAEVKVVEVKAAPVVSKDVAIASASSGLICPVNGKPALYMETWARQAGDYYVHARQDLGNGKFRVSDYTIVRNAYTAEHKDKPLKVKAIAPPVEAAAKK